MKFQNGQKLEISVDKKGHFRVKVDSQVKIETKEFWPFKWKWLFVSWFNNTPLVWKYHALNVMNQMAVCRDRQHAAPDVCCLPSAEGCFFFFGHFCLLTVSKWRRKIYANQRPRPSAASVLLRWSIVAATPPTDNQRNADASGQPIVGSLKFNSIKLS